MKISKKILLIVLIVLMLVLTALPSNATVITKAEAIDWMLAKIGQGLDYDGVNGNQCVDLIYLYYSYLGETSRGGNACDYATNSLPSGWQRISMTSGFIPQAGDIAVWKTNYTGQCETGTYSTTWYGHVGIIYDADSVGFLTINQNFNKQKYCTKNWFYLEGLQCVIRPNFSNPVTVANTTNCKYKVTIAANNYITLYDTATTYSPSKKYYNPQEAAFSITSYQRLLLSNGTVRYKFVSNGSTLYLPWNPAIMTSEQLHDYSLSSTSSATCTSTGKKNYKCTCGAAKSETIAAKGHNYSTSYTTDKEPTCTEAGSKSYHCSRCSSTKGSVSIPAKGHNISSSKLMIKKPTCTVEGIRTISCINCDYSGTETVSATGHDYSSEWTVDKAATCTEKGMKSHHCTKCSATSDSTEIALIPHKYGDSVVDKAATCIEDGISSKHCSKCSAKTEVTTIGATGHRWGEFKVVSTPTTEVAGKSTRTCLAEGCSAVETIDLPKLAADGHAHDFGEWVVEKAPSCEQNGTEKRYCVTCGEAETHELSQTGHSFDEWGEADSNGIATRTCSSCGKSEKLQVGGITKEDKDDSSHKVELTDSENQDANDSSGVLIIILIAVAVLIISGIVLMFVFLAKKKRI